MRDLVKEIQDIENGLTAVIYRIDAGYSVSLRDDDANETIQIFRIFPELSKATEYAYSLTDQAHS